MEQIENLGGHVPPVPPWFLRLWPQLSVTVSSYFIGVGIPSSDKHLSFGPPEVFTL